MIERISFFRGELLKTSSQFFLYTRFHIYISEEESTLQQKNNNNNNNKKN